MLGRQGTNEYKWNDNRIFMDTNIVEVAWSNFLFLIRDFLSILANHGH